MLTDTQVKNNTEWLLNNASPAVQLLTYKNILNKVSAAPSGLAEAIEKSDVVKDIFSKQKLDGSWCASGAWAAKPVMRKSGYSPISPKYVTTSWILPLLGDSGYCVKDERIKRACEYVLSYQFDNGFIDEIKPRDVKPGRRTVENEPCRFSIVLIGLGKVGAVSDQRVKKALDRLLAWQREDGGWVSESHSARQKWNRSCPFASCHAAYALYCSGIKQYEEPIKKALNFLLDHLSAKQESDIQRFFYHGHSLIHELLMFTDYSVGLNSAVVNSLLEWLCSMYQPDQSCFRYNGKPVTKYQLKTDYMDSRVAKYRLFQMIEKDWLTYYGTLVFKNMLENFK